VTDCNNRSMQSLAVKLAKRSQINELFQGATPMPFGIDGFDNATDSSGAHADRGETLALTDIGGVMQTAKPKHVRAGGDAGNRADFAVRTRARATGRGARRAGAQRCHKPVWR